MLSQLQVFGYSCLFGAILGIIYDVFRVMRMFFKCNVWNVFLQDIIYFLFSGILTFLFVLLFNFGEIRFYILAGEVIGWGVYYITLGEIVYRVFKKFSKAIKGTVSKIWNAIFKPVRLLMSKLKVILPKKHINNEKI